MGLLSIAKFIWQNPGNKKKRLRKLARVFEWQVYKRTIRKPRVVTLPNGVKFKAYPDCVISSAVQYAEWPEYHEIQYCRRHLCRGDLVLDVGANVGHFAMLMSDVIGAENLFCFEPARVAHGRLVENFSLNGWPVNRLFRVAVGSRNGSVEFPDTETPITTNSIKPTQPSARRCLVKMKSLDLVADELHFETVGLLKIDVEGFEAEVFSGAKEMLVHVAPRLIMFESLQGFLDPAIREILSASGYHVFALDEHGKPELREAQQNLFAAPISDLEQLA